jgi:hypothetical protein
MQRNCRHSWKHPATTIKIDSGIRRAKGTLIFGWIAATGLQNRPDSDPTIADCIESGGFRFSRRLGEEVDETRHHGIDRY